MLPEGSIFHAPSRSGFWDFEICQVSGSRLHCIVPSEEFIGLFQSTSFTTRRRVLPEGSIFHEPSRSGFLDFEISQVSGSRLHCIVPSEEFIRRFQSTSFTNRLSSSNHLRREKLPAIICEEKSNHILRQSTFC